MSILKEKPAVLFYAFKFKFVSWFFSESSCPDGIPGVLQALNMTGSLDPGGYKIVSGTFGDSHH